MAPERYDYDLQRQRQLERAGWRFARIRASEFYADQQAAVERIARAYEQRGIRPAPLASQPQKRSAVQRGAAAGGGTQLEVVATGE